MDGRRRRDRQIWCEGSADWAQTPTW